MFDQHFLSAASTADVFGPLQGGERVMWRGRCGVAEYAFDEAASLPRWTLPETTDVLVTDHRVLYAYTAEDGHQVRSGELRWLWPQHLRVQPGARSTDRGAAATQIQLVCGGADGTYPALVFAGGELATVGDADRLANVIRQAIARFRVDNVDRLGLTAGQGRMLSRLLIGPEFRNHQGGDGQTVSLLGAMLVNRPAPAPEVEVETLEAEVIEASLLDDPFLQVFPADEVFQVDVALVADEVFPSDEPFLTDEVFQTGELSPAGAAFPNDEALRADDVFRADDAFHADKLSPADEISPAEGSSPAEESSRAAEASSTSEAAENEPGAMDRREDRPFAEGTRLITYRPGRAADAARALMAAKAEETTQQTEPATASRAADLAARIASLVSRSAEPGRGPLQQDQHPEPKPFHPQDPQQFQSRLEDRPTDDHRSFGARLSEMRSMDAGRPEEIGSPQHEAWSRGPWHSEPRHSEPRHAESRHSESRAAERAAAERTAAERGAGERGGAGRDAAERPTPEQATAERPAAERADMPTSNLAQRAESMRRTAARMAANAARGRVSERRGDREPGISTGGNRNA